MTWLRPYCFFKYEEINLSAFFTKYNLAHHNDTQEKRRLAGQISKLKKHLCAGKELKVWSPMYGYALTATVEQWSDSEVHVKYTDGSREIYTWADILQRLQISTVKKNVAIAF